MDRTKYVFNFAFLSQNIFKNEASKIAAKDEKTLDFVGA